MKKALLMALAAIVCLPSIPSLAVDGSLAQVLITEVQTGSLSSAGEEFVELYNPNNNEVDITGWLIEYKSATGISWSTKSTLSGQIAARGFYLVSTADYLTDLTDAVMGSGLAQGGGHIRLVQPSETDSVVNDVVGWGTADSPEGLPAPAPQSGESLKRSVDADAYFIDTGDNSADFTISSSPAPQSTPLAPIEEDVEPDDDPVTYKLVINELYVDPVSPETDANDEFVELYNPNDADVDLTGYKLQTGSSLQYGYVIGAATLPAYGYMIFRAADTGLILGNSGGRAQVLDPSGMVAATLVSYETAVPGESWSLIDGEFAWTDNVTPAGANLAHSVEGGIGDEGPPGEDKVINYPKILITELLPDPDDPQTDERDEFVELYNPNDTAVNVGGYILKTGSTLKTSYVLPDITIEPKSYIALFSADAKISLANGGGNALLLDPNNIVVGEITPYPKAPTGQSWALIEGKWQWTAGPSPAAANTFVAPPAKKKKAASKKSSSKKVASATSGNPLTQPAAASVQGAEPNWRLIAGVSALAAGYMIYEMRYDLRNQIYRFKKILAPKAGKP